METRNDVVGDISLFFRLEMEMHENRGCENISHHEDRRFHGEDKAEWRVHFRCGTCHRNSVKLYCDRFVQKVSDPSVFIVLICTECRADTPAQKWLISKERL